MTTESYNSTTEATILNPFSALHKCSISCPVLLANHSHISSGLGPIGMVGPLELGLKVAFYLPAICTALIGNLMVIWIILTNEKLRQVNTNLYILNLAIADILVAVFCMWTHLWNKLYTAFYWPHSAAMCKIVFFMRVFVFGTSIFTLVAIGIDRCLWIVFPLKFRWTRERNTAIFAILATWISAISISMPEAIFRELYIEIWKDRTERLCSLFWPTRNIKVKPGLCRCDLIPGQKVYKLFHIVMIYYIPVVMLFMTYSLIIVKLLSRPTVGKSSNQHRGRRKAIKMLICVFFSFLSCWSPMYILNTIMMANDTFETQVGDSYEWIKYATLYTAFLSSALNPLIYAGTNENFREGFVRIFTGCRRNRVQNVRLEQSQRTREESILQTQNQTDQYRNGQIETESKF